MDGGILLIKISAPGVAMAELRYSLHLRSL